MLTKDSPLYQLDTLSNNTLPTTIAPHNLTPDALYQPYSSQFMFGTQNNFNFLFHAFDITQY